MLAKRALEEYLWTVNSARVSLECQGANAARPCASKASRLSEQSLDDPCKEHAKKGNTAAEQAWKVASIQICLPTFSLMCDSVDVQLRVAQRPVVDSMRYVIL